MSKFKKGEVVRVRNSALDEDNEYWDKNRETVERYGYLYIVLSYGPDDQDADDRAEEEEEDFVLAKSVATGAELMTWLAGELERVDAEEA